LKKQIILGCLISGVCLYFALRGISLSQVLDVLRDAKIGIIFTALILYFLNFIIRALRWSCLIQPLKTHPPLSMLWVLFTGFFANNVLPFRMGELARAHFCARKLTVSRSSALGTIAMERLCDMVSFLLVFVLVSATLTFPNYIRKGAFFMGLAALLVIVMLVLMHYKKGALESMLAQTPLPPHWKEKIAVMVNHFTHSTIGILTPKTLAIALLLSVVVWSIEATFLFLIAQSLSVPLAFMGAFFLLFALGLSVAIPQGPGYVGTYEFFGVTALGFLGIEKAQALPVVLAAHGLQFLFIGAFGLLGLWKEKLSFKSLSASAH
jgi:glycosyltransferase 2 family protein